MKHESSMNAVCRTLKVLESAPVGQCGRERGFYQLRLACDQRPEFTPGAFVMLRPRPRCADLLWGRPFSILDWDEQELKVFFQVVGRGTGELGKLQPGDAVDVWGPLGNGWARESQTPTLLAAGGVGLASFMSTVLRHPSPENLRMIFGHTAPLECYPYERISRRIRAEHFHEQGPEDLQHFIELLEATIPEYAENGLVQACGPMPFLRTVKRIALQNEVRIQLSLETRMACGVGACMGCVTECADPGCTPLRVCNEGPVFWARDILLPGEVR